MRLVYLTTLNYPSELANHTQVKTMARNFQTALGAGDDNGNFLLVVNSVHGSQALSGIPTKEINCPWKRLRIIYATFWFMRHVRELKAGQHDTVFYCKDPYLCAMLIMLRKFFGYRVAFESHLVFHNWLDRKIARRADAIFTVTSHLKKKLVAEYGADEKRVMVSPDAVDLSIFDITLSKPAARAALNLPADKIIFGYTGRFKTMGMDKGIAVILKALKIIKDQEHGSNVLFVAVGGSEKDILEYTKLAQHEDVSGQIMFKGYVSQADLARYQKACDALLMPFPYTEHYAYYMSPLKMFEYMASRVPMIVSDLPSVRDVLHEKSALWVEPGNAEGLATTMKKIIVSPNVARAQADAAHELSQRYTWSARAKSIIDFLS